MLEKEILNTNLQGNENIKMYVDASKSAVCAVVTQNGKIVACTSKVLNPSQKRWSTVERELYALSWGLKKMRFYLHGVYFEVFSDHKPLLGLVNKEAEPPNNRIATMLLSISEYTFLLKYLPGARNVIADFGTRNLDTSEWDKAGEDDEEGLHELFLCPILQEKTKQLEEFLNEENMTEKDYSEIEKLKLCVKSEEKLRTIMVKGEKKIWVPYSSRRSLFWQLHNQLHQGTVKIYEQLQQAALFWPFMTKDIERYLSQCVCATKKTKPPHKYSEKVNIKAKHPLHILAIDLYAFGDYLFFTAIDIFSKYSWVKQISDKQAATVLKAYQEYCQTFAEPLLISCDNGSEFNLIQTERTNHPSEHPAANGVIERYHQELGKLARIFGMLPDAIFNKLNSITSTLQFNSFLKVTYNDPVSCVINYTTRKMHYNDLVWRCIPKRKREKQQDTFTGPHRVLKQIGKFSYEITSHLKRETTLKVNVNDMKMLHLPETSEWKLNEKYFQAAITEMGSMVKHRKVYYDLKHIGAMVSDILAKRSINIQFFIIPDWPCMEWYAILHSEILAEAIKLPKVEDLFLDKLNKPIGNFAWDHWLFELR